MGGEIARALRGGPAVVLAALLSLGGDCGECPPVELPEPMTALRAKELDPSVVEGIGVSTTWIAGDCRPREPERTRCPDPDGDALCFEGRAAMQVLIVPVNTSIPRSPMCGDEFAVEDLRTLALVDASSSERGELVIPLAAGRYRIFVSKDGRCATCGFEDSACLIEVPKGGIVARDLVLDEAAH